MSPDPIPLADITDDEIHARLAGIIAASLRIPVDRVTRTASLVDLGAESIDIVEISMDVEHAFCVLMPEHSILQLTTEVAGEGVAERDGMLTDVGSALLRVRMPEVDPATLAPGTPVTSLTPAFLQVDVWMRVVRGLLEATPRTCVRCQGRLVQGPPGQVKCVPCPALYDVPSGDDLGREWIRRWMAARPA